VDFRERHFGRIASQVGESETVDCDVGALVRRLILFEDCTVESIMLKEIPDLVRIFGFDGVLTLIESPNIQIVCDALTAGQVGQTATLKSADRRGGTLPLGSYRIVTISIGDRKDYIHPSLQAVHDSPDLGWRQIQKLKRELASRVIEYPRSVLPTALDQFKRELISGSPASLAAAIGWKLRTDLEMEVGLGLRIDVDELENEGDYRLRTNLSQEFGLGEEDAHKIVEQALLDVAGLEQRFGLMKEFAALTGFQDHEVALFEAKLSFMAAQLDPGAQEARFDRVVTIAGLPALTDLEHLVRIDVDRLLALREDSECREFRQWARTISSETDEEINEHFASLRERLSS
jgi:hypothetical protein